MRQTIPPRIRRFRIRPLSAAVAAALGSGYAGTAALAQDTPAGTVEEITVTASRRETRMQDLPFNIAAFGEESLERQRLTGLAEFSRWVPGLTVANQGPRGANLMTVRGLNVLSLNGTEFLENNPGGTVQTYLGDIPVYLDLVMHDVERVEVLIGPQGTLYGAGTLGGAIRYIPRAPDTQALTFDVHGDLYGLSHSDSTGYSTDVAVNVPLVEDRLALRASVSWLDDPGFIDYSFLVREPGVSDPEPDLDDPAAVAANLRSEQDVDWSQTLSGRVALLWDASDRVRTTFNYYFQDADAGGRTVNHRQAFGTGRYESANRFLEPNDRETDLLSAEVVVDLGFAELTSATGVSDFDQLGQRDQTDLLLDLGYGYEEFPLFSAYTREVQHEDRVNEEIRLVSTGTGPWSWIGGLFYNELESDASSEEFTPGYPEFRGLSVPTGDLEFLQLTQNELTEQALFGEVARRLAERWHVTLGGRYFDYDTVTTKRIEIPFFAGVSLQTNSARDDGFLGKINVAYDASEDTLAYLTVSEGYRIGGVNSIAECEVPPPAEGQHPCALPDEVPIKPDRTTNVELGLHSAWRDGRLNFSAAVYQIDWDDVQTLSTTMNGGLPFTVNGGSARSRGVELSLQSQTRGPWSFRASYAYNEAQLTEDAPGIVDREDAFDGDRLAGTPEQQGSVFAMYRRTLANGWDLDASYGLTFTSDVLTKVGLRHNGEALGGYTVHHAAVGLGRDTWSARLYADNLTDKFAETGVRQDPSFIRDVNGFALRRYFRNVLRPRTVGIEFRYQLAQ